MDVISLPCDCCGARDERFIMEKRGSLSGEPFRLIQCRSCKFLYFNPRPTEAAIASLYDREYYAGGGFDPGVAYFDDANMEEKRRAAALCRNFKAPPARLLDFGCGTGGLAIAARELGYDAEGYEPSADGATACAASAITTYAKAEDIPASSYDIAVAIEVIEHAYRPSLLFEHILRVLKPGGVFVYTTWNPTAWLILQRLGLSADHGYILPEGHLNFFSYGVMKRFLARTGFEVRNQPFYSERESAKKLAKHLLKSALRMHLPAGVKPTQ